MKIKKIFPVLSLLASTLALSACGSSGEVYLSQACYKAANDLCIEAKGYTEYRDSDTFAKTLGEACTSFGGTTTSSTNSNCSDAIGALGQSIVGYCDFNAGTNGFNSFPETVSYSGASWNAGTAQADCTGASGSWRSI